jgi:hypothetical protein
MKTISHLIPLLKVRERKQVISHPETGIQGDILSPMSLKDAHPDEH